MFRTTLTCFLALLLHGAAPAQVADSSWPIHSPDRPQPQEVTPGSQMGGAPSDAIVLFDGTTTKGWQTPDGRPAGWTVNQGALEVKPGSGSIETVQSFGDCQLHLEWAEPDPPKGEDQSRGNSGVILMGLYEVQVLDSYQSRTYADGTVGAIYGQYPPLVKASRPPGEWQSYDIIFRRPRFDAGGNLLKPARITVLQNGILVQDNAKPTGPASYYDRAPYVDVGDSLPLVLQEHGSPVRYRNLWLRPLTPEPETLPATSVVALKASETDLHSYIGTYGDGDHSLEIAGAEHGLEARFKGKTGGAHDSWPLYLIERDSFLGMAPGKGLPLHLGFVRDDKGVVTAAVYHMGGHYRSLGRQR